MSKNKLLNNLVWNMFLGSDIIAGIDPESTVDIDRIFASKRKEKAKIMQKDEGFKQKTPEAIRESIPDKHEPIASSIDLGRVNDLDALYEEIKNFNGCSLKTSSTNTVCYDGVRDASVMLIGEAPGEEEDKQGRPFCGKSGQLLDKVLLSIGLNRQSNLYITNTVYWRPPANRKPTEEEIRICYPFLEKQIEIIKPKLIITCGSTSTYAILKDKSPMMSIRQKIFKYKIKDNHEVNVIPIYHPSFLLRNPIAKKSMWHDMLFVKDCIDKK